jgi:hypothetical protein
LEDSCQQDINDSRFIAYLQLHEFEALLLADIEVLADQYPNRHAALRRLARSLRTLPPEHVNRRTPPSHRIRQAVPEYDKVVAGVAAVERIGLHVLRERCGHFGEWLGRLEELGTQV